MLIDLYAHESIIMQLDIVTDQSRSIDDAQLEIDQRCYKTMTMVGYDNYAKTKAVGRNSELSSLRGLVTYKLSYVIRDVYCSQKRYLLRGRLFRAPA